MIAGKPLRNLLETAQDLGASQFVDYAYEHGFELELTQAQSPLTLFVPTNKAFDVR